MKKSFTLIEVVIVIIILGILTTISYPLYENAIEDAKAKVCDTNQIVGQTAAEICGLETDRFPGSLSQLKPEHLRKAWAKVFKENNSWKIKFAYFLVDLEDKGLAYAQTNFFQRYLGGDIKLITCPKDETPPPSGVSYGINKAVANITYSQYKALSEDTIVIGDCDCKDGTFERETDLTPRHSHWEITGKKNYAININKKKEIKKIWRITQPTETSLRSGRKPFGRGIRGPRTRRPR